MNLQERLQEITRLSSQMNKMQKELEEHKKAVKEYAASHNKTSLAAGEGRYYNRHWIPKLVFNVEKAAELIKSKGFTVEQLSTPVIDPTKVEALLTINVLTPEEFASCFDDKGFERWVFEDRPIPQEKEKNE